MIAMLSIALGASAQVSKIGKLRIGNNPTNSTPKNSVAAKVDEAYKPPIFVVEGDVSFTEPSGNGAIDAGEECLITMKVKNQGFGPGKGLKATIKGSGSVDGLNFQDEDVPDIPVSEERLITFPIKADSKHTKNGTVQLEVALNEPNGFGSETYRFEVETRAFLPPMVQMVDYTASSSSSRTLKKITPFDLQVLVQNVEKGKAEDVSVDLMLPDNVICLTPIHQDHITLRPGETKEVVYTLIVNQLYNQSTIPITVALKEKEGLYAQNGQISLSLEQKMGEKVTVQAYQDEIPTVTRARLGSLVDRDIPVSKTSNPNTYVLIMANSRYLNESNIATAEHDGDIMYEYCEKTLGIPQEHITFQQDLTMNQMSEAILYFSQTMELIPEGRFLIFYYGHGMTDSATKETYLIPVDGSSERVSRTCFKRSDMINTLSLHPTQGTVIFMESCFSGSTPEGNMLSYSKNSSGVLMEPREELGVGKTVLISASSGAQTANAYEKEQHNLFTYYLLKTLKDTGGEVTLGELFDQASAETKKTSHLELHRSQEPSVFSGPAIGNGWREWKLK